MRFVELQPTLLMGNKRGFGPQELAFVAARGCTAIVALNLLDAQGPYSTHFFVLEIL